MKRLTKKSKSMASFFAGIGGFDLGFEAAGFNTVLQCEINGFCNNVLELRWPKVKRLEDINLVEPSDIPDSDIWCGGFLRFFLSSKVDFASSVRFCCTRAPWRTQKLHLQ